MTQAMEPEGRSLSEDPLHGVPDKDRGPLPPRAVNRRLGIVVVLLAIALGIMWGVNSYFGEISGKKGEQDKLAEQRVTTVVPAFQEPPTPPPKPTAVIEVKESPIPVVPALKEAPQAKVITPKPPPPDPDAHARRPQMLAPSMREFGGVGGTGGGDTQNPAGRNDMRPANPFAAKIVPTVTLSSVAKAIKHPSFTLTKGTTLGVCNLLTAIDTEQQGMVTCTLNKDVLSTDGKVVLFHAGSLVVGEYQNGLEIGQQRIFVVWGKVEDKLTHIVADIASPATDPLGRAGVGGHINSKFWTRFGAAMLFSIVDSISVSIGNKGGGSGGTTVNAFTTNSASAARTEVKSLINIYRDVRPTLQTSQGSSVSILLARDVDFSAVYKTRRKE